MWRYFKKCLADIGNLEGIVVLPPQVEIPYIKVSKSASPSVIEAPEGNVTYTITVENNGTVPVVLTQLSDDKFGLIDGNGSCALPQELGVDDRYSCSFTTLISGSAGDVHTNIITATANDEDGDVTTDDDSASVDIVTPSPSNGSIGNLVWNDLNADGIYTTNEPGIEGVRVILYKDTVEFSSTLTASDGSYEFSALEAGNYSVSPSTDIAPLKRMMHTGGLIPHDIALTQNQQYTLADFGFSKAEISVTKIALQTTVLVPSASVEYRITVNNESAVDVIVFELFDDKFGNLANKGCSMPQHLGAGNSYTCNITETITGSVGDKHINSVVALSYDGDYHVHAAYDSANVNFVDGTNAAIGHFIWNDENGNGIYEVGEGLLDSVTLDLNGTQNSSTTTKHSGYYDFINLSAGDYVVNVTDTHEILKRAVLTTSNEPYIKTLTPGEIDAQVNFGYAVAEVSISKDANTTTIYEPGEAVTFNITVHNTGVVDLNITNLYDSKFGLLNTDCSLPQIVLAKSAFTCNIVEDVNGSAGEEHTNIVSVLAKDSANHSFVASDNENIRLYSR